MAKKNMASAHEMLDMELNSGHGPLHPDPQIMSGNVADFTNLSLHPHSSSLMNFTNPFMDHSSSNSFYGSQYKALQSHQPVPNMEVGYAPPNFVCNPYMASSSGRFFPVPVTNGSPEPVPVPVSQGVMGIRVNEYGGSNQFFDNNRALNKRKNPEMVPGNSYYHNGATSSSSSSNPGLQYWNRSFEAGSNLFNAPYFTPPEHQNGLLPMEDGHQQSVRSRPNMFCLQPEPSLVPHQNHLLQGNFVGQPFQPIGNTRVDHFVGSIGDAGSSNWNYVHATSVSSGRSSNRGSFEMGDYGNLGYQDSTSSRNPVTNSHPLPFQNRHHHIQPVQGMNGHNYNHHHQIPAPPYSHSVSNSMYHGIMNNSRDVPNSGLGFPRQFPSSASERMYGPPRRLTQAASGYTDALMDAISPEDVAILQFSGFGVEEHIDRHRDMRMDIDSMSYEELLALQEQIGDVNTGLSEEYAQKHLKTRVHVPCATLSLSIQSPSNSLENGTCIICQVEFEENERIGTLDCGHDYHADCIKQWLLMKNLCPICKTAALSVDKRKGVGP